MLTKLGLFGGSGKMGQAVEQMLPKFSGSLEPFLFVGKKPSSHFSMSAGQIENIEDDVLAEVDVWIDFTSPEGLSALLSYTRKFKTAVVSGSTGLTQDDFLTLKSAAKSRSIFWASNMSPGLWAFRQALKGLANVSHFDFAIEETHHNQKKDKPSGTAKTLQGDLEKITKKKIETPVSLRLGGVFGVHTVYAASSNEVLSFQHQALNRTVFAEGALLAAGWVQKRRKGFYSMDDMYLKEKK